LAETIKVLSFLTRSILHRCIAQALRGPLFVVDTAASATECKHLARLARYEAILVHAHPLILDDNLNLLKRLRQVNPDAFAVCLCRCLTLQQRQVLFNSGTDDCVGEPFFAAEMVMRLGL
jgi:DNA-binding response OmpR family regulator